MYFLYIWFLLPCCIRAFAYVHKIRFDFRAFSSATLGGRSDDDNFFTTFSKCVNSEDFRFSVWQKLPKLYNLSAKKEKLLFGIEDLQHSLEFEFFDAGRGCCDYERSGWSMRTVSKPTGTAFEDANLKFSDIQSALQVPNGE